MRVDTTISDHSSINCNVKWKLLRETKYCAPLFENFIAVP